METFKQERLLIRKMLAGELNMLEKYELSEIIDKPYFKVLFEEILDEQGGELELSDESISLMADRKLVEFYQQLEMQDDSVYMNEINMVKRVSFWRKYRYYAASVVILMGLSAVKLINNYQQRENSITLASGNEASTNEFTDNTIQFTEYINEGKQRLKVKLEDGSVVTLGRKSKLRYPQGFDKDKRDVYLEGEAFFEVEKDKTRPFTVITDDIHTRVLGTSFKVSSYPNRDIEVAVVTGKVSVNSVRNDVLKNIAVMLPGDKIKWNNQSFTRMKIDPQEILGWKNELMIFRKQSLKEIMTQIGYHYGMKVNFINEGFMEEKLSLTISERSSVQKTMNILSVTAGFEYSIDSMSGKPTAIIIK
ncbi:FecR family protein [Gynurincola endophyticus]|uniref:FecR family protein n=1 Tax=Gynurincola endophyticus TaxID=2479004 RepID=UPI000F8E3A16|nr:FecR family protein [Gynurincola endophyticus]